MPLPIPQRPWSHIAVDFVMDLPVSNGYTAILIVVDRFSKGVRFLHFHSSPTTLEVAEELFRAVFLKKLWTSISLTSRYHLESNRQAERSAQELNRFLRMYCHGQQHDWVEFLGWTEYA